MNEELPCGACGPFSSKFAEAVKLCGMLVSGNTLAAGTFRELAKDAASESDREALLGVAKFFEEAAIATEANTPTMEEESPHAE